MVTTPWWVLVSLVQITVIGLLTAYFYFARARQVRRALASLQQTLQQQQEQATHFKLKIAEMELQLESLDAFQEMYFELQDQHEKLQAAHEAFTSKANELLSDEDQAKLQTTLYQLRVERDRLEQKLQEVGSALQRILDKQHFKLEDVALAGKAAQSAVNQVDSEIQAIGDVIEQQQHLIDQLNEKLATLQLEVDAKQQLETAVGQLKQQNRQMGQSLGEMHQQNEALRKEIQAMAVKERAADSDAVSQFKEMQQALEEKEQAYNALYKKYVAIEAEYQKIYAKTQKIKA